MKTLDVKNLFVGTMDNETVVTLNIKQVESNGVYTLDAHYCQSVIEHEKIYDVESELTSFIDNARYDNNSMRVVFDWLYDYDCALSDLAHNIASECEGDVYKTREILEAMDIYCDHDSYEEEAIATTECNGKKFYLIEQDSEVAPFDGTNVWGTKLAYPVFIQLFALIEVYNHKYYSESLAEEIKLAVEKCNANLQEHFEAFIQHIEQ